MKVLTKQAHELTKIILDAGLVPMLHGSPGTAKSSIIHQIAKERNLKVIDLRLSQSDPTDLNGFPSFDKESNKAGYVPMDTFPIEGDEIPEGYNGWMLSLDEFNSAPTSVQAAAYKLVLDRAVGKYNLHEKVHCVAAGNLQTDNAIVNRLSTAMQSRLVHLEIDPDADSWLDWANTAGIDFRVTSFIEYRPTLVHSFDSNHNDKTFPCYRTWEFVSDLLTQIPDPTSKHTALFAGTIGEGPAVEFMSFLDIFKELVSFQDILKDPENAEIPEKPNALYGLSGMLSDNISLENFSKVMNYVNRMPKEFQAITLRRAYGREPSIFGTEVWNKWIEDNYELVS